MSGTDSVNELLHDVPLPVFQRILFVAAGGFAIVAATWELSRGAWPLNATSPIFGLIIAGAWAVGFFFILAGLFGDAVSWRVTPGRIEVETRNLFRWRSDCYQPSDICGFSLREIDWDSRPRSWCVMMTTQGGQTHETRDYESRAEAERLRNQIEAALMAAP